MSACCIFSFSLKKRNCALFSLDDTFLSFWQKMSECLKLCRRWTREKKSNENRMNNKRELNEELLSTKDVKKGKEDYKIRMEKWKVEEKIQRKMVIFSSFEIGSHGRGWNRKRCYQRYCFVKITPSTSNAQWQLSLCQTRSNKWCFRYDSRRDVQCIFHAIRSRCVKTFIFNQCVVCLWGAMTALVLPFFLLISRGIVIGRHDVYICVCEHL